MNHCRAFLFLTLCPIAGGAAMADDVTAVTCGPLTLGFARGTGQWRLLAPAPDGPNLLGGEAAMDLEVQAAGRAWPAATDWKAAPPEVEQTDDAWRVRVVRESADWEVTAEYRVVRDAPIIERTAGLRWRGAAPIKVQSVAFRVPGLTLSGAPDATWSLPGNFPAEARRLADSVPGRVSHEQGWTWSDTGCAYVYSEGAGVGLVVSYSLEPDHAHTLVEEIAGGVSLVTRFDTLGVFEPGDQISVGTQWIRVVTGDLATFRQAAADLAGRANPGPPADRPQWLEGAVIEELHPWGRLEAWGAGDRGDRMDSLEAQLPYLRDLGIDGIWLLPVSNKPPWVYFLPTFRNLDPQVTTPEQLRAFIAAGHRLGLHTLMDLVTYGISPDSPDVASLPEHVWCHGENGERQKAWGDTVLCADLTEPDWNAHIVDLTSWWVREFGADGFRLDCGGSGQAVNWQPHTSKRANATLQYGGIRQNALIRDAIREIDPDAVLLPEAGMTAYFRSADLLFDYPFYMVCREITREPCREVWVQRTRDWLAAQQMTHPLRQQFGLVRSLENHDTVAAQDFFGIGPSQALTALCAFIPGTLLLYQEQEIGFAPELRGWLKLRHELPELRRGDADYRAIASSNPNIMAFLRFTEDAACIVAVNFGSDPRTRLSWPEELARRLPVCQDALTGEEVRRGGSVRVPPFRPRVFTLRREPRRVQPPKPAPAGSGEPLPIDRSVGTLEDGTVRHSLDFAPVKEWSVSTCEGSLHDEFVDRHRGCREGETHVDATPPLWRCWRPLEQGYWDGAGTVGLGVVAEDGRAAFVRVPDPSRLKGVRMTDQSSIGSNVRVILEGPAGEPPYAVEQRRAAGSIVGWPASASRADYRGYGIEMDPLWVRFANGHCAAQFARRHGGTLFGLGSSPSAPSMIDGSSEVYTDWGLFDKGLHVATEWETNPRLSIDPGPDGTQITFRGKLRRPAWNGVHAGYVIEPAIAVRLTYDVGASPTVRVTFGATPTSERPNASAFLAYRIPFAGVDEWEVSAGGQTVHGKPGEKPGERVFQGGALSDMSDVVMTLRIGEQTVRLKAFSGTPDPPQNPFLLDGGPGVMHVFVAMLNGEAVDLKAGGEITASFAMEVS